MTNKWGITYEFTDSALQKLKDTLPQKIDESLADMANECKRRAFLGFIQATYSGDNDVYVEEAKTGELEYTVTATGDAVAFIEFGTGITQYGNYPVAKPEGIVEHGQYGLKKGANPDGWYYHGNPGTGSTAEEVKNGFVHTYGDPAQMPLWYGFMESYLNMDETFEKHLND